MILTTIMSAFINECSGHYKTIVTKVHYMFRTKKNAILNLSDSYSSTLLALGVESMVLSDYKWPVSLKYIVIACNVPSSTGFCNTNWFIR